MLFRVGNSCLDYHIEHAAAGYTEMVQDLRKACPVRHDDRSASSAADAFWHWAYLNVAESLAEGTAPEAEPSSASVVVQFGLPSGSEGETQGTGPLLDGQVGPSPDCLALVDKVAPRHLPPLLWEQINWERAKNPFLRTVVNLTGARWGHKIGFRSCFWRCLESFV